MLSDRFSSKFIVNEHGCWLWTASKNKGGYGQFGFNGKMVKAHRYAYEQLVGPIPDGYDLDHFRNNEGPRNAPCSTSCCNPAHLEPVTRKVNARRGRAGQHGFNSGKTHCKQGHEYNEENTYHHTKASGGPARDCRVCNRIRKRERYETLKLAHGS